MSATNYCAEFLDQYLAGGGNLAEQATANFDHIRQSVKFRLPHNGLITEPLKTKTISIGQIKSRHEKYLDFIKLPFDKVSLEFLFTVEDDRATDHYKIIVLARNEVDGGISFNFCANSKAFDGWRWNEMLVFIEPDYKIRVRRPKWSLVDDDLDLSRSQQLFSLTIADVILGFLSALACSNTGFKDIPASNMLNKKRIKKGKQPFFSYKVLTIDTKADTKQHKGGMGTGNTKRVHLRRGHIRRLPNKTVWVNPCVVGDKSKGMVTKDYKVK